MSLLEAIVYGIVQGLTEFLPISSTAHLRVVPELFGWKDAGAAFTAVIQLGTLVAVLLYFKADIVRILKAFWVDVSSFRYGTSHDAKMAWMIAVGTIPVVVCGFTLKKYIEEDLRDLRVVAYAAIGFALVLAIAEVRAAKRTRAGDAGRDEVSIGWRDVLLIGCFQALALIPGASRSGVTISAGLFAGLSRSASARFSFLLSLPAVFGAAVFEMYKKRQVIFATHDDVVAIVVASIIAGIIGYASIAFLLGYLKKHSTYVFIVYRILLGTALLIALQRGMLKG